jgi:hypothetical protein
MGTPRPPQPVMLLVGALFVQPQLYRQARQALMEEFGPLALEGPELRWQHTEYYSQELGRPLRRRFLFFQRLIDPGRLPEIKLRTNCLERHFSEGGRRRINLDPGYLSLGNLVLATTKPYSHRVYLREGIYAEVTLIYSGGRFRAHLGTYPDYLRDDYLSLFAQARQILKGRLSALEDVHKGP